MNEMFFFFEIEKRIGLKKLSCADLGISGKSNQTHIGLYNDVLQFLGDKVVTTAMLVYGDYCLLLDCYFDRIENPDGTYRSPKIRIGNKEGESVVSKIREFALTDVCTDWYLLWTGLEKKELVFWLINSKSTDFYFIKDIVDSKIRFVGGGDKLYENLKNVIEIKIKKLSAGVKK